VAPDRPSVRQLRFKGKDTTTAFALPSEAPCAHDVVYKAVVNLKRGFGVEGAVDVWTCTKCHEVWCDEKRIEHQELPPEVGLPRRDPGTEWAVLVCDAGDRVDWRLMQVRGGEGFPHSCNVFEGCFIEVGRDFSVSCRRAHPGGHSLHLVMRSLNSTVLI